MKKVILVIALVILFGIGVTPVYAGTFFDNFDDDNADGWWLGYSHHTPWVNGNWRVEYGKLVQDLGGDDFVALVENIQVSDQTVNTDIKINSPSGYDGITIWYKDSLNRIIINLYPASGGIWISEVVNGIFQSTRYPYISHNNIWYNLKVIANSVGSNLDVYIDDVYLFTHAVITPNRTGQSGVTNGNAGGYFDNFSITSDSIADPLADKEQCKNEGWKIFINPAFKNQGACISYLEGN